MNHSNSAKRKLGRAWGPIAAYFEGSAQYRLAWMPAHCSASSAAFKMLSNRFPLCSIDVDANAYVDKWAKAAASEQAPAKQVLNDITAKGALLEKIATWIGTCTAVANKFLLHEATCGSKAVFIRDSDAIPARRRPAKKTAKRKRSSSPTCLPIPGDLSKCARWNAVRLRILGRHAGSG